MVSLVGGVVVVIQIVSKQARFATERHRIRCGVLRTSAGSPYKMYVLSRSSAGSGPDILQTSADTGELRRIYPDIAGCLRTSSRET